MQVTETQKHNIIHKLWSACPIRNVLMLLGAGITALYFLFRENQALMNAVANNFVRPYHLAMGKICSVFQFSCAELLYVLAVIFGAFYIVWALIGIVRGGDRALKIHRFFGTFLAAFLCSYGAVCLLWGVLYHSDDFETVSNMESAPISTQQLEAVTKYFAEKVDYYGDLVPRDASNLYYADVSDILDRAKTIYRPVEQEYKFLFAAELSPKPIFFSKLMSYINFTGFFFPFTGEANVNVDSPISMLPSTVAHELAHQRGVAPEDEANFTAVLACMQSGDNDFEYSGALLAYINLSNALYTVDYDAWYAIFSSLSAAVIADLDANSAYWAMYETKAAEVSESVYTGFLQSQGETLGMKSYGACVNLLVAHYYEEAIG